MKTIRHFIGISAIVVLAGLLMSSRLLDGEGAPPSPVPSASAPAVDRVDMRLHASPASLQLASPSSASPSTAARSQSETETALVQELRAGAARVLVQEKLSPHQIGVRELSCKGRICHLALQLPPFVEASMKRDSAVAAELMDALRVEYRKQGAQVALTRLDHARDGMSIALQVETAAEKGRYLTDAEIARLRAETIEAYLQSQKK